MKRLFDMCCSLVGCIILLPLFIVVAVLIKFDSKGPVFFLQERVGRNFKSFKIFKFRSMYNKSDSKGPQITAGGDRRITKFGQTLRKYKIDELPQLINVLKGEMSLVGPRPEVKKYVELYREEYQQLLKIRPGITDPASIRYSKEEGELSISNDWEKDYINKILPEKIKLSLYYMDSHNLLIDVSLIFKTIFRK